MAQRAADRVGEVVEVLLEEDLGDGDYLGRAAPPGAGGGRDHDPCAGVSGAAVGELISARVAEGDGVDLVGRLARACLRRAAGRG